MSEIVRTGDGSDTIYIPELDEHYHSVYGAIRESEHIFTGAGFEYSNADPVRIFEVGFGTGLNALLTCIQAGRSGRKVIYTSIEKYPLDAMVIRSLNYTGILKETSTNLFETIHDSPWNSECIVTDYFTLLKINGDLISETLSGSYDLIYFDAFGPDKQPEMWSEEIFGKIAGITAPGGILVTYSVKGLVKRSLKKFGFTVSLLPGPPGKRHILRAVKN